MDKLPMCRICLVQNVHMYVVSNKNLQELYEKLTDIPFVTDDSRPILACFVCCAQLKKCYRLLTKCLEAEERFAQIKNGNFELKPFLSEYQFEIFHGFISSPIQIISIVENDETESIAVKEELEAVCEGLDDIIEPNEEHSSDDDDLKPVNLYDNYLDIEDIQLQSHHSESDSEEELPFLGFETEVAEEPDVSEKNRKAKAKTNKAPITKKPKLDTRRISPENTITAVVLKRNEQSNIEVIRTSKNCTSIHGPSVKESYKSDQRSSNRVKKVKQYTRSRICENLYNCDVCQRSFSQKADLKKHFRIHTGEKPYQCDICQRSFSQQSHLTEHNRTHFGIKPYHCDVCQRSFSQKCHLISHGRIHTGEKPYQCDICQRSFSQQSHLTEHNRIHTGEKPYQCDVCQISFSYKWT